MADPAPPYTALAAAGRPQHRDRRRCLAVMSATLGAGLLLAACGGSHKSPGASQSTSGGASGLAFSRCMRSHGIPRFPDPNAPGSGFQVNVSGNHASVSLGPMPGINTQSPAFVKANLACQQLLPGGAASPGQQHPGSAAMTLARTAAKCMRGHGVPNFPDPGTFMPTKPPAHTALDNINGAVFLIPDAINLQAPAVQHAARVCHFPGGLS